jgi:tetratricopeptide (TPR) repeat protein
MRRKVNWQVLGCLLLGVVLLGGGAAGLYFWQGSRTAADLLARSRLAEDAGRLDEAADALGKYFFYRPRDIEQLTRYARVQDRIGTPSARDWALLALEKVLRAEPRRDDLRRMYIRLALERRRFGDARMQVQVLLKEAPEDGELEHLLGRCAEGAKDYRQAATWYEKACEHAPAQVESYVRLAGLHRRRLDQPQQADQVMDEMVAANESSFQAYLARARYRKEYGTPEDCAKDVGRARDLAPEEPAVLLALAELDRSRNDLPAARTRLTQALTQHPRHAGMCIALAGVELQASRPREAIACLRQGLEAAPEQDELLEALAEAQIEAGETDEAAAVIGRLRKRDFPALWLDYLDARLLMHQARWGEAIRQLETVRQKLTGSSERAGQVDHSLALCHERLGNTDQAVEAYRRAVRRSPRWVAARFGLASALAAAGQTAEALAECRALLAAPPVPAEALTLYTRMLTQRVLRLPSAERKWQEVEQALAEAARAAPASAEATVLRADVLSLQERPEQARTVLEQARDKEPDRVAFWVALAGLSEREGKPEQTAAILDQAQQRLGDRIELRLARVRHETRRGSAASPALTDLERGLEKFTPEEQSRLLAALAEAHNLSGEPGEAGRLWQRLAERFPNDLRTHLHLFDLALQANDEAAVQRELEAFRRIEGEEGTFWLYGEATRLVLTAQRDGGGNLERASRHRDELARRRPGWSRVALLTASIAEAQGDTQAAVENYERALGQGEFQPAVLRRLVQLLLALQRYQAADGVFRKLKHEQVAAGGLGQLAAEVSLHTQGAERALELASAAVPAHSTDYRDHLWLGQILRAAGKAAEAEAELREAVRLAAQAPEAWAALVRHLAAMGKEKEAEAALQEATSQLPTGQAPLALAPGYEALGRLEQAEEHHRAALAAAPENPTILHLVAAFYLRNGQPRKAELHLRKLLDARTPVPVAGRAWARRTLAEVLAGAGSPRQFREALDLLGPGRSGSEAVEEHCARARVLATRAGRWAEATSLLEAVGRQRLPDDDLFLLAQLQERQDDWRSARVVLAGLTDSQGNNPNYLAFFARGLIRHGQPEQARAPLAQLEKREPQAFRTLEVKARLLAATGQGKEAVALLQEYGRGEKAPVLLVAGLLEELGEDKAAESLYRQNAALPGRPEGMLFLAAYLGRQKRFTEALDLLDGAWQTCPPEGVAFTSLALLHGTGVNGGHFERVDQRLRQALEKTPGRVALLLHLAGLRELQARYGDAEAIYREVVNREPANVPALNNLAWLLAQQDGKGTEALALIGRALDGAGPLAELLDTRAVVSLKLGHSAAAVKDLEAALADTPTSSHYFHLAQAQLLAGNRTAAGEAWQKARAAGLDATKLHPLERTAYQPLLEDLGQP